MTAMDKRSLISESVMVTRIDIHPAGEEPDRHIVHVAPRSKSGLCSRDEVLAPNDTRLGCHPRLSHSLSNKPPQSREGRFSKIVPELLGLPNPIKTRQVVSTNESLPRGQNNAVLNRHRWGLPSWNLRIATTLSSSFPSEWTTFP
jgi:hypothetical protein